MDLNRERAQLITRRHFFRRCNSGMGALALASLLGQSLFASAADAPNPLAPKASPLPAKAKRVIYLHMSGSPPQHDLFDYKPELNKIDGQPCPDSFLAGERFAFIKGHPKCLGTQYKFTPHGQSGALVSELLPNIAKHVDDIAIVKSMWTDQFNHAPAELLVHTGNSIAGKASMGSWVTYGLGSENQNLPGFIVFTDHRGGPINGPPNWSNGYLPAAYQGTQFRDKGSPIVDLKPPADRTPEEQRRWLRMLSELNEKHGDLHPLDTELSARVASYELAFRMQSSAPEVMDLGQESDATRSLYGIGVEPTDYFGRQALMARRLVERGVRYVQIFSGGGNFEPSWDAHWDLKVNHGLPCAETDKPLAGLIKDLKSRGMFDDTLIVWHGEFGRLPISERMDGRDHNNKGFSVWLAGGGVKGGTIVGATDQYGYQAVENAKSVYELHATILHLLGLDFEKLTYRFNGRDMRLTDVHGRVIREILA
jgi:hypothetical protein